MWLDLRLQVIFTVNDVMAVRINIRTTNGIIHFVSSCFTRDTQVSSLSALQPSISAELQQQLTNVKKNIKIQ